MSNATVIGQETNHAVLVRVKDPASVARGQGKLAAFAEGLAPAIIENKVYTTLAEELRSALKARSIDADVSVVDPDMWRPADGTHFASDLALAVGGLGILGALWFLFSGRSKK